MRYIIVAIIAFSSYSLFIPSDHPAVIFLKSLNTQQLAKAHFSEDHERRTDWHFLPAGSYERIGIKLSELKENQRLKVHELLKSVLSDKGYYKTVAIIDLENILAKLENNYTHRDPDQYAIAIFGEPGSDQPWSWSFSGHHISYHFTYANNQISATPRFLGANPGEVLSGEKQGLRVLAAEEDLGFKLLHSLDKTQRAKTIISEKPYYEIVTTNESKVSPLDTEGISEKELTKDQLNILDELIDTYLGGLKKPLAEKRKKSVKEEELHFGWAGHTEKGKAHYYRIQGQTFLIEFDNAQNNANHIHTVWRDFDGDFGRDLILEHRKNHKH